jgi:hypothetical protein
MTVQADTPFPGGPEIRGPVDVMRRLAIHILLLVGVGPYEASIELLIANSPNRRLLQDVMNTFREPS